MPNTRVRKLRSTYGFIYESLSDASITSNLSAVCISRLQSKLLSLLIQGEESDDVDDVDDDEQAGYEDALDNTVVDSEEVIRSRKQLISL